MKSLKELLEKHYGNIKEFEAWKEKFPEMFEFSEQVKVIPWETNFAVADKNPEIIDQIELLDTALKSGMITEEEYEEKLKGLKRYASRTEGVAFIETKEVSFRKKIPSLYVALHELGHIYFEARYEPTWSQAYGGGEQLMWLIALGKLPSEGNNEEKVKKYIDFLELYYTNRRKAERIANEIAEKILKEIGLTKEQTFKTWHIPKVEKTAINALLLATGTMPSKDYPLQMVLVNLLEAVRWNDPFGKQIAIKFFEKLFNASF
jgi:hypothetical protein